MKRYYNKWHLELKWWLQEHEVDLWFKKHEGIIDIIVGVGIIILLVLTYFYFLRGGSL